MDEQSRVILAIAARVLSYPAEDYRQDQAEIMDAIRDEIDSELLQTKLKKAIHPLYQLPTPMIKEVYVETFDLKEKAGLYLTAHELGDSRKRGMELIALQTMIQNAGFFYRVDELADYMPMLYEFLAVSEDDAMNEQLRYRLSLATERIRKFLTEDNLYKPIITLLMDEVFEQPSAEAWEKLELAREKPDLDPMPYPLMYK